MYFPFSGRIGRGSLNFEDGFSYIFKKSYLSLYFPFLYVLIRELVVVVSTECCFPGNHLIRLDYGRGTMDELIAEVDEKQFF